MNNFKKLLEQELTEGAIWKDDDKRKKFNDDMDRKKLKELYDLWQDWLERYEDYWDGETDDKPSFKISPKLMKYWKAMGLTDSEIKKELNYMIDGGFDYETDFPTPAEFYLGP